MGYWGNSLSSGRLSSPHLQWTSGVWLAPDPRPLVLVQCTFLLQLHCSEPALVTLPSSWCTLLPSCPSLLLSTHTTTSHVLTGLPDRHALKTMWLPLPSHANRTCKRHAF